MLGVVWIENPELAILPLGPCSHGLGVRYREDLPVVTGTAPVSTALTVYTESFPIATSQRLPTAPSGLAGTALLPGRGVHHPRWR